jgi:hypothetical protein
MRVSTRNCVIARSGAPRRMNISATPNPETPRAAAASSRERVLAASSAPARTSPAIRSACAETGSHANPHSTPSATNVTPTIPNATTIGGEDVVAQVAVLDHPRLPAGERERGVEADLVGSLGAAGEDGIQRHQEAADAVPLDVAQNPEAHGDHAQDEREC